MKTRLGSFIGVCASFGIVACSDVRLMKGTEQVVQETKIPDGRFCSKPGDLSSSQLKVVFVVDMSLSNIGEFIETGPGRVAFDGTKATDSNGQRFEKIREFLTGCGAGNADNKFKVVGFSGGALRGNPAMSGCQGGFVDKDAAINAVANLKGIQDYNKANINSTDFAPSMQTTTYQDGLECAKSVVFDDIQRFPQEAQNSNYVVFFVTDGMASDNCRENSSSGQFRDASGACCPGGSIRAQAGACCQPGVFATQTILYGEYCCGVGERRTGAGRCEPDPDYQNTIKASSNPKYESLIRDMMMKGRTKASTIRLQPVYYGRAEEATDALALLDQIANWGDSAKAIQLNNVAQADFCKYASSPVSTQYQTSEFNVVNLTALMKNGLLLPDSDMDGVADDEDPDAVNPRSNSAGLLDGICKAAAGDFSCTSPNRCDLSKVNSMLLTECDLASYSLSDGDGLDYDRDHIPDFIEILRGTLPNLSDAFSNLDGDSLTNLEEIHLGRQVDAPDDGVSSQAVMNWSISRIPSDEMCPANQQNYKIAINRVPVVPTQKFKNGFDGRKAGSKYLLSHEKNENVLLIYYFSEPLNNPGVSGELYGTIVKVRFGPGPVGSVKVDPQSFQKLGSLNGKPQW